MTLVDESYQFLKRYLFLDDFLDLLSGLNAAMETEAFTGRAGRVGEPG